MTGRRLGAALMAVGALAVVVGIGGLIGSSSSAEPEALPVTTTVVATAASGASSPTSPSTSPASTPGTAGTVPETTVPGTTVPESTTTSQFTTTTLPVDARIEAFVSEYVGWIAAGDADSLVATLHPDVIEMFSEDLCRSFVEREILAVGDYHLTGPITSEGDGRYAAPVTFTFQGQTFDSTAGWKLLDGDVRWLATCR